MPCFQPKERWASLTAFRAGRMIQEVRTEMPSPAMGRARLLIDRHVEDS